MKVFYMLGGFRGKINHLLFLNNLKLYGKTMQELDSQVQKVRIFSSDIDRDAVWNVQCAVLEMKRG